MTVLAPGLRYFDLRFRQQPEVIATAVLDGGPDGVALIDPGPGSCLPALEAGLAAGGLSVADVRTILLTHIHLDHAGATGALVRKNPAIQVVVHESGAPHLIDPTKLLSSASRLFGADMEHFGEFLPVPEANVTDVTGGEVLAVVGRVLDVAYTPGHASHHVSYFDRATRIAFVGDTGGIRLPQASFVLPPTPPPDIDVEGWEASVARILNWQPETLFLTHFGPIAGSPAVHLQNLLARLHAHASLAKEALTLELPDDAARAAHFVARLKQEIQREAGPATASRYEVAMLPEHCWLGLSRYWRKRAGVPTPAAPRT